VTWNAARTKITIAAQGSENFGSTASGIVLFDDFESGTSGGDISLNGPRIGSWSSYNDGNRPRYDSSVSYTGSQCMLAKIDTQDFARTLNLVFSPRSEFFMSFWRRYSWTPGAIQVGKCKETWLMDGANGFASSAYDMCWPTRTSIGGTSVSIAGNDFNQSGGFNNMWYANEFARFAAWGKSNGSSAMNFYLQSVNQTGGMQQRTSPTNISTFFGGSSSTTFDRINIPGYYDQVGWSAHWDDIYFAATPARVEVGDSSTYANCRSLSVLPAQVWSASSVEADLYSTTIAAGDTVYVFDRNNTLITQRTFS
jgi:hypothetical protein